MFSGAINDLTRGVSLYHVWVHQAYHEISAKYKRTFLGSLWIAGGMVATALALSIVIGGIQGQSLPDTLPYVMCGILSYGLTGYILAEAPEVLMSSGFIIKNHAYPYTYYAFESITRTFFVFLHNLIAFYITLAILFRLAVPHWSIILALPLVYMNSFVWGTLASMVSARFRDMRFMLPFMSQIVFFMTPVFWHADSVKAGWRSALINFNPFYGLMEIVRSPLLGHGAPLVCWELSFSSLAVGLVLWLFFFGTFRGKIAFWV